jgi:hypothetical protein
MSPVRYELGSYILEDAILHSHCRENFKPYIVLTGWSQQLRLNVFSVRYELGSYILQDSFRHSKCRENCKFYITNEMNFISR